MSDLFPVAGSHIDIGGVLAPGLIDLTLADFSGQSWVEVDGWSTMGSFGDTAALISTDLINRGRTTKQKGTANGGSMANTFAVLNDDPGQIALRAAAAGSNKNSYAFRVRFSDAIPPVSSTVTMTIAAPGVITWTAHGFLADTPVKFETTGALPTGITAGTTYYVKNPTASTFEVAATPGGTSITTTGTQSGVHTGSTVPQPTIAYFVAMVMSTPYQGGEANTVQNLSCTLEINSNIIFTNPIPAAA
jgi:hypothetical protein